MSHNENQKLRKGRYKCPYCEKRYSEEYAFDNHKKVCAWKETKEEETKED